MPIFENIKTIALAKITMKNMLEEKEDEIAEGMTTEKEWTLEFDWEAFGSIMNNFTIILFLVSFMSAGISIFTGSGIAVGVMTVAFLTATTLATILS